MTGMVSILRELLLCWEEQASSQILKSFVTKSQ